MVFMRKRSVFGDSSDRGEMPRRKSVILVPSWMKSTVHLEKIQKKLPEI